MHEQDYILIAQAIKEQMDECVTGDEIVTLRFLAYKLASRLKADNENFNRETFLNAAVGQAYENG